MLQNRRYKYRQVTPRRSSITTKAAIRPARSTVARLTATIKATAHAALGKVIHVANYVPFVHYRTTRAKTFSLPTTCFPDMGLGKLRTDSGSYTGTGNGTIARVTCFECGDVFVRVKHIRIYQQWNDGAYYEFECPLCSWMNSKNCNDMTQLVLKNKGAKVIECLTQEECDAFALSVSQGGVVESHVRDWALM